jgi:hypothetical protein
MDSVRLGKIFMGRMVMDRTCTKCGSIFNQDDLHLFELPYLLDRYECDERWVRIITGLCYDCSKKLAEIVRDYI